MDLMLAFAKLVEIAERDGVSEINRLAGCWERQIGEWFATMNGHNQPAVNSRGDKVPPFSAVIYWRDLPAGIIDPFGGTVAAGAGVNEDAFIAACDAELETTHA